MLQTAITHANGGHSATASLLMEEDGTAQGPVEVLVEVQLQHAQGTTCSKCVSTSSAYRLHKRSHQFQNPGPRRLATVSTVYAAPHPHPHPHPHPRLAPLLLLSLLYLLCLMTSLREPPLPRWLKS